MPEIWEYPDGTAVVSAEATTPLSSENARLYIALELARTK
jgi:hypothetical protein